ncbi:hypothetical protein C6P42_002598 [Pichia californica]|nr:hypothetical protein C6P42_002598 [[Candida] californica]
MIDLLSTPKYTQLNEVSKELLTKVDDYALDYNIFLFKGIDNVITEDNDNLKTFINSLFVSIPTEYPKMIYNPIDPNTNNVIPSTTSKLQKRLLSMIIEERHRRDIELLNKQFENKIKYVELEDPHIYEIKSPFYQTFNKSRDEYKSQFDKLALLQSLEYDFEHELDDDSDYQNDNDLIEHFCDDEMLEFSLNNSKNEADVVDSEIVRVLLPLASQVILGENNENEDSEKD